MSTVNRSLDSIANWARNENEKNAIEKIEKGVEDGKKTTKIEIANSALTMLGKVQLPR